MTVWRTLIHMLGPELGPVSHTERLVSAAGGFVGILGVMAVSDLYLHAGAAALMVASMGASAVLLFAVPHGQLSQPWPFGAGHLVSAVVGVGCAQAIPDPLIAAPVAVGVAIGAMHYLRCIHPPGGATALTAVIGGEGVHALGYGFVLTPVLVNVLALLTVAVAFNAFFRWRRYPVHFARRRRVPAVPAAAVPQGLSHEDLVYALGEMDSLIDVTEEDLLTIYDLATRKHQETRLRPGDLRMGACYSNGRYGSEWAVRQIVDAAEGEGEEAKLIYKVVAGAGRRSSGVATRAELARWASYEVYRDEDNWRRAGPAH